MNANRKKIASAEFHRGLPDTFHSRFINRFAKKFTIKHIRTPHEYFRHLTPMIVTTYLPGYWCVSEEPQSKRRINTKTTLLLRAVSVSVEPINRSFGKAVSFVLLYYGVVLCSGRWWTVGSVSIMLSIFSLIWLAFFAWVNEWSVFEAVFFSLLRSCPFSVFFFHILLLLPIDCDFGFHFGSVACDVCVCWLGNQFTIYSPEQPPARGRESERVNECSFNVSRRLVSSILYVEHDEWRLVV